MSSKPERLIDFGGHLMDLDKVTSVSEVSSNFRIKEDSFAFQINLSGTSIRSDHHTKQGAITSRIWFITQWSDYLLWVETH